MSPVGIGGAGIKIGCACFERIVSARQEDIPAKI